MDLRTRIGPCLLAILPAVGCQVLQDDTRADVTKEAWGTVDGELVELYTLRNRRGTTLRVATYGAIVTELHVRDRDGELGDVVLGFDSLAGYLGDEHPYFGCVAGRCANRIAGAAFELDGERYELVANDGRNHLHGGRRGFDRHVWDARAEPTAEGPSLLLERVSPDGEEGYPGRVEASVRYTLTDEDVLRVEMSATTDAPTLVNLAQHAYWNLAGHASGTVEGHVLRLHASRYVPVDGELIPLGRFETVRGTPFDFRTPEAIGTDLRAVDAGPSLPRGYDHDFVIDGEPRAFRPVCELVEPASGRRLELWADQPGCQLYTGNFLDGTLVGKSGARYEQYAGLCLETQVHPDSIHRPDWPSPVLRPGERYGHRMELRFGVEPR